MALHKYTPYKVTATKLYDRSGKDAGPLELAALGGDEPVDLLDALEANLVGLPSVANQAKTHRMRCVDLYRHRNFLHLVFAHDYSGERELVFDVEEGDEGEEDTSEVIFLKEDKHVARIHSCCTIWRPSSLRDDPTIGVMLIHSPWGRAGSRALTENLLQKALRQHDPKPRAKVHLDPLVTDEALQRMINTAEATRVRYTKTKWLRSDFADPSGDHQSVASEMSLVVRGVDARPFRDALRGTLRNNDRRSSLFTIEVRDGDSFEEETFDDVEVTFASGSGSTTYSLARNHVPTMGYNLSGEVQSVYAALPPDERGEDWPGLILEGLYKRLERLANEARRGIQPPTDEPTPEDDPAVS